MTNYEILKVAVGADWDEIEASYQSLKSKYSEDRFLEGEAGKQGAINLMELEQAYAQLQKEFESKKNQEQYGGEELGAIDAMVKAGKLDEAQRALDGIEQRTGKWHFLQSVIFYKRNWYLESRAQLQLAINLDPDNLLYKDSMQKLEKVVASQAYRPFDQSGEQTPPPTQMDSSMGLNNCCTTLCCASLCCDLLQCL